MRRKRHISGVRNCSGVVIAPWSSASIPFKKGDVGHQLRFPDAKHIKAMITAPNDAYSRGAVSGVGVAPGAARSDAAT